jgi:hypothetical protein
MPTSNRPYTGPAITNQNYIHREVKTDEIRGMFATIQFKNYLPYVQIEMYNTRL